MANHFCSELEKLGGRTLRVNDDREIIEYIEALLPSGRPPVVAVSDAVAERGFKLREWLEQRGATLVPTLAEFAAGRARDSRLMEEYKRALLKADIGVTSADYGVSETGTLVLVSGGEQHRLISLAPPVHVCLLDSGSLVEDLIGLIPRLKSEFYSGDAPPIATTFITGSSRTADIELTLTLGVHGPRELHVLLV
jgi:L-lactate dehydrogenase complex protein LldG